MIKMEMVMTMIKNTRKKNDDDQHVNLYMSIRKGKNNDQQQMQEHKRSPKVRGVHWLENFLHPFQCMEMLSNVECALGRTWEIVAMDAPNGEAQVLFGPHA